MTITYPYGRSLYVNITNRCPNRCAFCVRTQADGFYADDLWLTREPTREEILSDILARDLTAYDALVFCGYGEPTERLDDLVYVCRQVKNVSDIPIRLNTNGLSDRIHGRSTARDLHGAVDVVSVSLNASTPASYQALCHSRFGEEALPAILAFAEAVKAEVPTVVFSAVRGTVSDSELDDCQALAARLGIPLRIRDYIQTET